MKTLLTLVFALAVSPLASATSGIPTASPDLSGSIITLAGADITIIERDSLYGNSTLQIGAAGQIDLDRDSLPYVSMLELGRAGQIALESGPIWVSMPDFKSGAITIASSVPEPQTYAMLLAGLGIIGTIARRRK